MLSILRRMRWVRFSIFPGAAHPLMKQPTLNVGRIEGGLNINSVPDRTRFDVDIRSAPNLQHATIRQRLTTLLGESVTVSTLVDLPAVLEPGGSCVD